MLLLMAILLTVQAGSAMEFASVEPLLDRFCFGCHDEDSAKGDVILTGTPEGVGPLASGDELEVAVNGLSLKTRVL